MSQREAAKITGVPRSTFQEWLKPGKHQRRVDTRTGRPKKMNERDVRKLKNLARHGWAGRKLGWRKLARDAGLLVSSTTVRRAMNKLGYFRRKAVKKPFISILNIRARKLYAAEHYTKSVQWWRPKIYGDESSFDASTRQPGEKYHTDCMYHTYHSGRTTIMVYGAISYNWKSPIIFIEGTGKRGGMTSKDYLRQVLVPLIGPAMRDELDDDTTPIIGFSDYVEDSAPPHGVKRALIKPKRELGIILHSRPASSLDLNSIESLWIIMKQRIRARPVFPGTRDSMIEAIKEEWDRLQPDD